MKHLKSFVVPFIVLICIAFLSTGFGSCGDSKSSEQEAKSKETEKVKQDQQAELQRQSGGNSGSTGSSTLASFTTGIIANNEDGFNWGHNYNNILPQGTKWTGDNNVIWKDSVTKECYYIVNKSRQDKACPNADSIEIGFRPKGSERFTWEGANVKDGYYYRVGPPIARCSMLLEYCLKATGNFGKHTKVLYSPDYWTTQLGASIASKKYFDCGEEYGNQVLARESGSGQ